MAVLITGGGGYIGSQIVNALQLRKKKAVVIDTFERGHESSVPGAKIYQGDVRNSEFVRKICIEESISTVVHCAGYKSVSESFEIPKLYSEMNVGGTRAVLNSLVGTSVRNLIFSSSCSVYGDAHNGLIDEDCQLNPLSPYAMSKLASEKEIETFAQKHKIGWVALRFFNAAGASNNPFLGEDLNFSTTLLPEIFSSVIHNTELILRGNDFDTFDGTGIRDYVHVSDLASVHLSAIDYLNSGGQSCVLNAGSGVGTSVLQILHVVEKVIGRDIPRRFEGRRLGDASSLVANISRIEKVFGWRPVHTIDDIVNSAYRWYQSSDFQKMYGKIDG